MKTIFRFLTCVSFIMGFLFVAPFTQAAGLVRSENFIISGPSDEAAEFFLKEAEKARKSIAQRYLGRELSPAVGPTLIHIQFDPQAVREDNLTWVIDDPRRQYHSIWLKLPGTEKDAEKYCDSLSHNIVHCVMATEYPNMIPVLREGVASRHDDIKIQKERLDILKYMAKYPATIISFSKLINADRLEPHDGKTYALSQILVDYMMSLPANKINEGKIKKSLTKSYEEIPLNSERLFVLFAGEASKKEVDSFENALRYYYGISSAELEKSFRARIISGGKNITLEKVDNTKP